MKTVAATIDDGDHHYHHPNVYCICSSSIPLSLFYIYFVFEKPNSHYIFIVCHKMKVMFKAINETIETHKIVAFKTIK